MSAQGSAATFDWYVLQPRSLCATWMVLGLLDTLDHVGLKHLWKVEIVGYGMMIYDASTVRGSGICRVCSATAFVCFNMGIWTGPETLFAESSLEPMLNRWQSPMTSLTSSSRAGIPVA